jgi:hypothetical protein
MDKDNVEYTHSREPNMTDVWSYVQSRPTLMRKIIMGSKYRRGILCGYHRRGHGKRRMYFVQRRNAHYIYT